jgi:hypothetical protein
MLETLFIWGLIIIPLGIAVVLVAYRARYFVVGIGVIILVMMLIWALLRFGIMLGEDSGSIAVETNGQPIACLRAEGEPLLSGCEP